MHRYFLSACVICLVLVAGCRTPQTVRNVFKETGSYYTAYLNPPASLDYDETGDVEEYQRALGAAVAGFDFQLDELERAMQNSDLAPDAAWVGRLTRRFPWLSGIALTDNYGTPQAQIPQNYPKYFNIDPLLEEDPKQQLKALRASVQMHNLGPELYVGNPVYSGTDFSGVIVAHFDPRALIAMTTDPGKFMLASPAGILWPGLFDAEATPLAGVDWATMTRESSSGILRNEHGSFYWISRYLGNLPLVYAIPVSGEFPQKQENMAGLTRGSSFALGAVNLSQLSAGSIN